VIGIDHKGMMQDLGILMGAHGLQDRRRERYIDFERMHVSRFCNVWNVAIT
jgi:hypothetical protein